MPSPFQLVVDESEGGLRLDAWLARRLPEHSRARLRALIDAQAVTSDTGQPLKPALRVRQGLMVQVSLPDPTPAVLEPEDISFGIIFEDQHLLVIDKPAGLVVHPGAGVTRGTLVNALLHHVRDLSGIGGVLRPGIVHRLDKGTSGLLLVAKEDRTHRLLSRLFASRDIAKHYLAVVHGRPAPAAGKIDAAIARDPQRRQRMTVNRSAGRAAQTSYAVMELLDGAALVALQIHTGRTHQVRVHMASLGHPLIGDATYGGRRTPASCSPAARSAIASFPRPALHAARLAFVHPLTGQPLDLTSPLPPDLIALLDFLRVPGGADAP